MHSTALHFVIDIWSASHYQFKWFYRMWDVIHIPERYDCGVLDTPLIRFPIVELVMQSVVIALWNRLNDDFEGNQLWIMLCELRISEFHISKVLNWLCRDIGCATLVWWHCHLRRLLCSAAGCNGNWLIVLRERPQQNKKNFLCLGMLPLFFERSETENSRPSCRISLLGSAYLTNSSPTI